MTDLPNRSHLTSGTTTEGQFQAAIGAVYDYLGQLVTGSPPEVNTILLGSIVPTKTFILVDTENNTAADNLDVIQPTNIGAKIIVLKSVSNSRVVTIVNNAGGTGQFQTASGQNIVLDSTNKVVAFTYNSTNSRWEEAWKNWGVGIVGPNDASNARANLELGSASLINTGTEPNSVPTNSQLGALARKNTIDTPALLNNGVVTNNAVLEGTLTLNKLANSNPNSLVRYNASGIPQTLIAPNNSSQVLLGNMTFGTPTTAPSSVGQSQLKTSIGSVSLTEYPYLTSYNVRSGTSVILRWRYDSGSGGRFLSDIGAYLPGGAYGFLPTGNENSYVQRYVTASPPFNIGDGECAGFMYLLLNKNGSVDRSYFADVPPWAYNGPTNLIPDYICPTTGKKYKLKPVSRVDEILRTKKKSCVCPSTLLSFEEQVFNECYDVNPKDHDIVRHNILNRDYFEIDDNYKNKDMSLLPHPFGDIAPGQTVALVGLYDDILNDLVIAQNSGENIIRHILNGNFYADNEIITGKKRPKGVNLVRLKIK